MSFGSGPQRFRLRVGVGEASYGTKPYRCSDCRSYFSIKTGTWLTSFKIPLCKWAIAIHRTA